jgi:hypothetical protein
MAMARQTRDAGNFKRPRELSTAGSAADDGLSREGLRHIAPARSCGEKVVVRIRENLDKDSTVF